MSLSAELDNMMPVVTGGSGSEPTGRWNTSVDSSELAPDQDPRESRTNFLEPASVHPDLDSLPQHHLTPPPRRSMSFVAWLDHSTDDKRRVREMIRLFGQPETQDALGFSQVRDAYGDLLFPGLLRCTRGEVLAFSPGARCSETRIRRGTPRTSQPRRRTSTHPDPSARCLTFEASLAVDEGGRLAICPLELLAPPQGR